MIWDTSSDWLFFRHWRHLWGAFRPFYGPFGPHPGPLWTLLELFQAPCGPYRAPPGALSDIDGTADFRDRFANLLFWSAPPLQERGGEATRALLVKD